MAHDRRDIVEIRGAPVPTPPVGEPAGTRQRRPFLSIWFRCCHAYGRIYRNDARSAYEGRCPRCGAPVRALIGEGGVDRRFFEAR